MTNYCTISLDIALISCYSYANQQLVSVYSLSSFLKFGPYLPGGNKSDYCLPLLRH
jgi:hypothetical protein